MDTFLIQSNNEEENIEENVVENRMVEEDVSEITIHIMGQVERSGIVKLKEGARVIDAIEAAGGMKAEADMTKVSLAYVLEDGQKVYIPSIKEKEEIAYITKENGNNVITGRRETSISEGQNKGGKVMININTANQSELEQLPGMGSAIAMRIVTYRSQNGNFKTIEDIKNVSGIGNAKFNSIKDYICVK